LKNCYKLISNVCKFFGINDRLRAMLREEWVGYVSRTIDKRRIDRLAVAAIAVALLLAPAIAHMRYQKQGVRFPARASESRRGRPRKFVGPSRAVTVTLPDDVIAALQSVNPDLSLAVATVVPASAPEPSPIAELVTGDGRSVIVIPPNRMLQERAGVELVPLPDGRALIAFDETLSASHIELRLADAVADPSLSGEDRAVFEEVAAILRRARRDSESDLEQRNILVLRRTRVARTPPTDVEIKRAV
jgi:hypothetical protein